MPNFIPIKFETMEPQAFLKRRKITTIIWVAMCLIQKTKVVN